MPNTLAHIAVQATAGRVLLKPHDFVWCLIGLVIPDVAWIIWRIGLFLTQNGSPYSLKLYAIVQSSLFGSVLLCAAIAALARKPVRAFAIMAINSGVHLLLDATQIKWANGALLGAPFTWQLTRFDLFWPESWVSDLLTVGGLLGCIYFTRLSRRVTFQKQHNLPKRKIATFGLLLLLYLTTPLLFGSAVLNADLHFIKTLSKFEDRPGKAIELDRVFFQKEGETLKISTLWGDTVTAKTPHLKGSGTVSLRGTFIDHRQIKIEEYHQHRSGWRDSASLVGLAWIFLFIGWRVRAHA